MDEIFCPITVNAGEFYISGNNKDGVPIGNLNGAGFDGITDIKKIRALVLLHEVARAAGVIPQDGTNPSQSKINSERIRNLFVPK